MSRFSRPSPTTLTGCKQDGERDSSEREKQRLVFSQEWRQFEKCSPQSAQSVSLRATHVNSLIDAQLPSEDAASPPTSSLWRAATVPANLADFVC